MRSDSTESSILCHGTTVAIGEAGVLITGPSGSGKSSLALQLLAFGAGLVADDGSQLVRRNGQIWASVPTSLPHAIEARGIGLLPVALSPPVPVIAVVDMSRTETARHPEPRTTTILGHKVALLHKVERAHFPAAIMQYVRGGGLFFDDSEPQQ